MANKFIPAIFKKIYGASRHIFPPFIALFYLSLNNNQHTDKYSQVGGFILSALIIAGFGYFVNDASDTKNDQIAGKKNMAQSFSVSQQIIIALLLWISGMTVFYISVNKFTAFILLLIQTFLFITYSVKPFRAKNNPVLGPLHDTHYSHILPVFITLFSFFNVSNLKSIYIILFLYLLLLAKGIRNILLHQLDDRKGDYKAGIKTFPIRFGALNTLNLINRVILPLEFLFIILLSILSWPESGRLLYGFGAFVVFYFLNFSGWKFLILPYRQLKFKFLFVLNDFYEYWLPYLCIWSTSLTFTQKLFLTLLHSFLFFSGVRKFLKDSKKIAVNLGIIPEK